MNVIERIPVLVIVVVLIVGVVYGAGIWIINTGVPVKYNNPISIQMSDEIQIEEADQWQNVTFRDTTTREHDANFSHTEPPDQFYTYVNISNHEGSEDITVQTKVEKPKDFGDDEIGFTVRSGIIEPGFIDYVDRWNDITNQTAVQQGEAVFLTVVYTLDENVTYPPQEPVVWNFSEV